MTPSVFPRSSLPRNFRYSHFPAFVDAFACGMDRAIESIRAMVCSATETALAPGVFITSTPFAVAAVRSTLSTAAPARPMTRSFGAIANTSAVTRTALRTTSASASARCCLNSRGLETITFHPARARSSSMAACAIGSAIKTFMPLPARRLRPLRKPSARRRRPCRVPPGARWRAESVPARRSR